VALCDNHAESGEPCDVTWREEVACSDDQGTGGQAASGTQPDDHAARGSERGVGRAQQLSAGDDVGTGEPVARRIQVQVPADTGGPAGGGACCEPASGDMAAWRGLRLWRCRACGTSGGPTRARCPACGAADLERAPLPRDVTLLAWSAGEDADGASRVVGLVEARGGARLACQLADVDPAGFARGQRLRLVLRRLRSPTGGPDTYGPKAVPCR